MLQRGQHHDEFEKRIAAFTSDLDALKSTYEAGLATQAPVTYWSEKRRFHQKRSGWLKWGIAAYFVLGFSMLAFAASQLLVGEAGGALKLPLWHLASFTTVVALFIWTARILVRMMLSHEHLAIDAYERSVIANTYLALVRRGKFDEKNNREGVGGAATPLAGWHRARRCPALSGRHAQEGFIANGPASSVPPPPGHPPCERLVHGQHPHLLRGLRVDRAHVDRPPHGQDATGSLSGRATTRCGTCGFVIATTYSPKTSAVNRDALRRIMRGAK